MDTFNRVAGASAGASQRVEEAAKGRVESEIELIVERGGERSGLPADFAEQAIEDIGDRLEGGETVYGDRRDHGDEADEEGQTNFAQFRMDKRDALRAEVSETPDVTSPADGGPEDHGMGPSKGGEQSTTNGGGGGDPGGASVSNGGGDGGTPQFGPIADAAGVGGIDYSNFATEGALTAARLAELGTGGGDMAMQTGKIQEFIDAEQESTGNSVTEGEGGLIAGIVAAVEYGATALATATGATSVAVGGATMGLAGAAFIAAAGEVTGQNEALAHYAADNLTESGRYAAAMDAKAAVAQQAAQNRDKNKGNSPTPDASQPAPDGEAGGGIPTAREIAYSKWLLESTGRGMGPVGGDVDPADGSVTNAPAGTPDSAIGLLGTVGVIGQPVTGDERAGINPRGGFSPDLLAGERGNVDPSEGDDTGPWTSEQHTEDPADALDTGPTLGLGALPSNSSSADDSEEDEDG